MSPVGVVVALAAEARALTPRKLRLGSIEDLDGVRVHVCGMGLEAAAAAALSLAESGVAALAVYGVAGALDAALVSGALLCPRLVLDRHGARYVTDAAWRMRLAVRLGGQTLLEQTLLTVDQPLLTPQSKAGAGQDFKAVAVDMESAAVAQVASTHGLPFLALRAIADGAQDSVPAALADATDPWGRARPATVASALARHPQLIPQLPRLAGSMNRACAALRRAAQAAGPGLAYAD